MCGESWVARQRPQRRRGRATVPPVDPAARVRVREAQAAAFAGRASGRGSHNFRYDMAVTVTVQWPRGPHERRAPTPLPGAPRRRRARPHRRGREDAAEGPTAAAEAVDRRRCCASPTPGRVRGVARRTARAPGQLPDRRAPRGRLRRRPRRPRRRAAAGVRPRLSATVVRRRSFAKSPILSRRCDEECSIRLHQRSRL